LLHSFLAERDRTLGLIGSGESLRRGDEALRRE